MSLSIWGGMERRGKRGGQRRKATSDQIKKQNLANKIKGEEGDTFELPSVGLMADTQI